MKFKCGISEKQQQDAFKKMHEHLREWKKVFAFLPTTVSNSYEKGKECVWFEYYEERYIKEQSYTMITSFGRHAYGVYLKQHRMLGKTDDIYNADHIHINESSMSKKFL